MAKSCHDGNFQFQVGFEIFARDFLFLQCWWWKLDGRMEEELERKSRVSRVCNEFAQESMGWWW